MNVLLYILWTATPICFALDFNLAQFLRERQIPWSLESLDNSEHDVTADRGVYASTSYAIDFLRDTNNENRQLTHLMAQANWNYITNVTTENKNKLSNAEARYHSWLDRRLTEARKFKRQLLPENLSRQLELFTLDASPRDKTLRREHSDILATMKGLYSSGKACLGNSSCQAIAPGIVNLMSESRDPKILQEVWLQWRDSVGPKVKPHYIENVRILGIAARDNGYSDYSQYWKQDLFYDTPELDDMIRTLWSEVKPLYLQLHAYVRRKLRTLYGPEVIGDDGTIPAHLLGDLWAQHWEKIMDIVSPFPTQNNMKEINTPIESTFDVSGLFRVAENFFTSIGLFPMTWTFWEKSMFTKPEGVEVICHASAMDLHYPGDFRIKMCTNVNYENFKTIHHEIGHVEYFMAYADQPSIFRDGANAAFHEAVGDTIGLSALSRSHLQGLGLVRAGTEGVATDDNQKLGTHETHEETINTLLRMALDKVAFLPFGLLVDEWRWQVLQGGITPETYNRKWWEMRLEYQGIKSPVPRSEEDFDPGAKYHIPANSGYISYFISYIQQFQMYKALCQESGHTGPLHQCDFYGSKEAGRKLRNMLRLGSSQPWQNQLKQLTGESHVTSTAIWEYFRPLYDWLVADNTAHGERIGWEGAQINWAQE